MAGVKEKDIKGQDTEEEKEWLEAVRELTRKKLL